MLALEHRCKSIAFPAIPCGAYGLPLDEAAEIAIDRCSDEAYKQMAIKVSLFSTDLYDLWNEN